MKIMGVLIWLIISMALIGALASSVFTATNSVTFVDSFTQPVSVPSTFKLSAYEFDTLTAVKNGTTTRTQYVDYNITEKIGANTITLYKNASTMGGTTFDVTYTGSRTGIVGGIGKTLMGLVILIVIAGVIAYLLKTLSTGKKK